MCISSLKTSIYCLLMLLSHLFPLKSTRGRSSNRELNKDTELLLSEFSATESSPLGLWNIYLKLREAVLTQEAVLKLAHLEVLDAFFLLCCH